MKNKLFIVAIISLIIGGLVGSQLGTKTKETTTKNAKKVRLVADLGGVNDKSFNESAFNGMKSYCDTMGLEIAAGKDCWYLEGDKVDDESLKLRLTNAAEDVKESKGSVIAVGFKFAPVITEVANKFKDVSFIGLDVAITGEQPKNIYSVLFSEAEAGYLAGISAGYQTKSNKVSFVGGMQVAPVINFGVGYIQGVEKVAKELGKKISVDYSYSNSFTDQPVCKQIAQDQISKGADVVFAAAGPCGTGSFTATTESSAKFIGVDSDQSLTLEGGDKVLTSAVKRLDNATVETLTKVAFNAESLEAVKFFSYPTYANISYKGEAGKINPNFGDARITDAIKKLTSEEMKNLKTFATIGKDEYTQNTVYELG
jgi:basic membrane protein A